MTTTPASTDHRYRRWEGALNQGRWTWLVMVVTGVRLKLKVANTRGLLLTTSGVVLGTCIVLYVFSLLEVAAGTDTAVAIMEFVRRGFGVDVSGVARIEEFREILWAVLFLSIIKIEMFWVLIIVAKIGPGLIANDLKHGALPIYFSKPVTPLTYLAGKWLTVALFVAAVTLIPNLASLSISVLFTGGLHTAGQTLALAVDLLVSGLTVCFVSGAIILALSSMTSDYRYVTVAWLAICLLPPIAQGIIYETLPAESTTGWLGCLSLQDNIVVLTDWLFATREAFEASSLPTAAFAKALVRPVEPVKAAVVLGVWTVASLVVCYRRVVTFSRSAANV